MLTKETRPGLRQVYFMALHYRGRQDPKPEETSQEVATLPVCCADDTTKHVDQMGFDVNICLVFISGLSICFREIIIVLGMQPQEEIT